MSHLSRSLITEAKLFVNQGTDKNNPFRADPFEDRDAFVIGLARRWSHLCANQFDYYDEKKYRALKKKARRYVRAALSEMYPTRMFMRSMKHSARFAYLKLKNSI